MFRHDVKFNSSVSHLEPRPPHCVNKPCSPSRLEDCQNSHKPNSCPSATTDSCQKNAQQHRWTPLLSIRLHTRRRKKFIMIVLHVHRGECKAGARLPVLHVVGDSVSAREVLKIRRRLNLAAATQNKQKQHTGHTDTGTVPLQQQELSYHGNTCGTTLTHMPTLSSTTCMPKLSSTMHATTRTANESCFSYGRQEQVNATSEFSSALARAFIVASEPAMKVRSQISTRRNSAPIDNLRIDPSCYGQDLAGNFFSKFAESHDSGSDTPCDKFAENYKGEDYDGKIFGTRELSTDFTRGISADVACLENFQDFSCLTWTEDDFNQIPSESSPMPYDTFLASAAGLMPARKKARTI